MSESTNVSNNKRDQFLVLKKKAIALKAARINLGLSRQEAARLCRCSIQSFDQIENARVVFTDDRLKKLANGIGIRWEEFQRILKDPEAALKKALDGQSKPECSSKPRRNTYKVVSKEIRVLKILRERKQISQCEASRLCSYSRCSFGQIEHGRIELPRDRILYILSCLKIPSPEFDRLMKENTLKDETIADCRRYLLQLDEQKLDSVQLIIKSFLKS